MTYGNSFLTYTRRVRIILTFIYCINIQKIFIYIYRIRILYFIFKFNTIHYFTIFALHIL